jgi:hypothetical protein
MEERRSEPRRRVLLAGRIVLPGGGIIDCTVRNRSDHGARLAVVSVVGIPDAFTLRIEPAGETLAVKVAWRKAGEIGVRIIEG